MAELRHRARAQRLSRHGTYLRRHTSQGKTMTLEICGPHTLLVTPFDHHGNVDLESMTNLIEFVIEEGVHGVMALGSSGEFFTLSMGERHLVMKHVIEVVCGRVPVTIGI